MAIQSRTEQFRVEKSVSHPEFSVPVVDADGGVLSERGPLGVVRDPV